MYVFQLNRFFEKIASTLVFLGLGWPWRWGIRRFHSNIFYVFQPNRIWQIAKTLIELPLMSEGDRGCWQTFLRPGRYNYHSGTNGKDRSVLILYGNGLYISVRRGTGTSASASQFFSDGTPRDRCFHASYPSLGTCLSRTI